MSVENRIETVNMNSESDVNREKWTTEKMRLGSHTVTTRTPLTCSHLFVPVGM